MEEKTGAVTDEWLRLQLAYAGRGLAFGLQVCASKPGVVQMMTERRWNEIEELCRGLALDEALAISDENGFSLLHLAARDGQLALAM